MEKCVHNAPPQDTCPSLAHSRRFPKAPQGVPVWDCHPLVLQLWTPGQREVAKPSLPSTTGRLRWVGGEKKVNPCPRHGHTSSPIEAAPVAILRKPNLFNFSPVISDSTWFDTKVQLLFAKTPQVMASHELSGPPLQLLISLHFTAAGPEFCTPRYPSAWPSCRL